MTSIATLLNVAINRSESPGTVEGSKLLIPMERFRRPVLTTLVLLPAALLAAGFAIHYVHAEDPAYFWDYRGYWDAFKRYGHGFESDFTKTFYKYVQAVWVEEYNPTPITPLLPLEILLGATRAIYITCLVVGYLIPCAAAAAWLAKRIRFDTSDPGGYGQTLIFFALACVYPPFWSPTLRGFPDIIGLLPLTLASIVVIEAPNSRTHEIRRGILLGLLLWLPFLFRRWYAYAVISFLVSLVCLHVVEAISAAEFRSPCCLRKLLARYGSAAAVIAILIAGFQGKHAWQALSTNYAEVYSAYQVSTWEHLIRIWNYFGPVILGLTLIGMASSAYLDRRGKVHVVFLATNIAAFWILFTRVQIIEICHYLPIALWMFIFICRGVATLSAVTNQWFRAAALAIIFLLAGMTFYGTYYPLRVFGTNVMSWVLPHDRIYALRLHNFDEYRQLVNDLLSQMAENDQVAVMSSSLVMADDLLDQLSDGKLHSRMIFSSHIDKRDHFASETLLAQYVVVCDPIQTHVKPTDQQVITVPAKLILAGKDIGKAYVRLPRSYTLSRGVKAFVFKKTRAFTIDEVQALFEQFYVSYPDWRREYEGHLSTALMTARISLGKTWGWVHLEDPVTLLIHPGWGPTLVDLPLALGAAGPNGRQAQMTVRPMDCSKADGVDVTIKTASGPLWSGTILPGDKYSFPISADVPSVLISVDPRSQPLCDHFMIRFPSAADNGVGE